MSVVTGLIKDFKAFYLEVPYLEIPDRGITVLWGPSGAGKTTVFRTLIGLEECKGLEWQFEGMNIMNLPIAERHFGVVLQNYGLFPHMTAMQNVKFAANARKIINKEQKMTEIKEQLQLNNCWNRLAKNLSGGEQQRVALARALIGEPKFLFLDEPFSALDKDNKKEARELVKKVIHDNGVPTLLITHDKEDVDLLADEVIQIDKGKILLKDSPSPPQD